MSESIFTIINILNIKIMEKKISENGKTKIFLNSARD